MQPIVVAAFVAVLLLILVPYYVFIVRGEQQMLKRLRPRHSARARKLNVLKPEEAMSSVGTIDTMLRTSPVSGRIQTLLDQAATPR